MRIGVDVGGTFTDAVSVDEAGVIKVFKTSTTQGDVSTGTIHSIVKLTAGHVGDSRLIVHGTTLVTNALLERKTPPIGLLTTAGFRDSLEIRRTRRERLYDLAWRKPQSLIPRRFRFGIRERIDSHGSVLLALEEGDIRVACEAFRRAGIRDVAVCFLFAFRNDSHERRAAEVVRELLPEARISLSSEVLPELREYERSSTTVLNAMACSILEVYLQSLEQMLVQHGFKGDLRIIKADGGIGSPEYMRHHSLEAFNSGPAAGVAAAVELGRLLGLKNLLTLDMGGTSTDVSLVWQGEPVSTMEEELEFGIPIRIPMVYIRSIGAGGGSVAWIDSAGGLRVGPQSAGSDPGPACYARGGTKPTLTDANLILGQLDPNYFLGGAMQLDIAAAEAAVGQIAISFGWSLLQAAEAISRIALANLVQAIREVSVDRGYDPRDFALVAYGGAGPLYAAEAAADLGVPEVVVPLYAGVFSAMGCLCADFTHERLRTVLIPAIARSANRVREEWQRLEMEGRHWVGGDATMEVRRFVDMRYIGEAAELMIEPRVPPADESLIERAVELFHSEHQRLYGFRRTDPVEIVNVRCRVTSPVERPGWAPPIGSEDDRQPTQPSVTDSHFSFYRRSDLAQDGRIKGPAVLRDRDSTTLVPAGQTARLDQFGNVRIGLNQSLTEGSQV